MYVFRYAFLTVFSFQMYLYLSAATFALFGQLGVLGRRLLQSRQLLACSVRKAGRARQGGDRPYSSSDNTTIPHTTCTRCHTSQCLADTGLLTIQQHHTPTVLVQAELYCNILQESAMRWGNRACLSFSG